MKGLAVSEQWSSIEQVPVYPVDDVWPVSRDVVSAPDLLDADPGNIPLVGAVPTQLLGSERPITKTASPG